MSEAIEEIGTPTGEGSTLPSVSSGGSPGEVIAALDAAARRGKLAGFEKRGGDGFVVDAFGAPFDYDLIGRVSGEGDGSEIRFSMERRKKMPIIAAVLLLVTIEPGRYFMDQLIPGEWGWINTMWWYYPLTILPLPWVWIGLSKRSERAAREHAGEQIEKVRGFVGVGVNGQ
ncbi:MAG: hypothetical protein ACF8SC_04705 [Phycisphaerales bacterium JB037]